MQKQKIDRWFCEYIRLVVCTGKILFLYKAGADVNNHKKMLHSGHSDLKGSVTYVLRVREKMMAVVKIFHLFLVVFMSSFVKKCTLFCLDQLVVVCCLSIEFLFHRIPISYVIRAMFRHN